MSRDIYLLCGLQYCFWVIELCMYAVQMVRGEVELRVVRIGRPFFIYKRRICDPDMVNLYDGIACVSMLLHTNERANNSI